MTEIELEQAKLSVDRIFRSAMEGEDVIITDHEKPVLRLTRISNGSGDREETNALALLQNIRFSGSYDLSTTADLYAETEVDE